MWIDDILINVNVITYGCSITNNTDTHLCMSDSIEIKCFAICVCVCKIKCDVLY